MPLFRWPALAGVVLTAVLLTGCGSDDDTGSTRPATTTTTATSPASSNPADSPTNQSGTTIDVTIAGGRVTPDPSRKVEVSTGDEVHITVSSDQADGVHVHGYDIETEVRAGETAQIDFTADIPGQFEVEAHELSAPLLFTLVVR